MREVGWVPRGKRVQEFVQAAGLQAFLGGLGGRRDTRGCATVGTTCVRQMRLSLLHPLAMRCPASGRPC